MPTEMELLVQAREIVAELCAHGADLDVNVHLLLMEAFNELNDVDSRPTCLLPPVDRRLDEKLGSLGDALAALVTVTSDASSLPHYLRAHDLVIAARDAS